MTHDERYILEQELLAEMTRLEVGHKVVKLRDILAPMLARHPGLDPPDLTRLLRDLLEPPPTTLREALEHAAELEALARLREAAGNAPI